MFWPIHKFMKTSEVVSCAWHINCHVVCVLLIVLKAINIVSWPRRSQYDKCCSKATRKIMIIQKAMKLLWNWVTSWHFLLYLVVYVRLEVFACEHIYCGLWGWHPLQSCSWWLPTLEECAVSSFRVKSPWDCSVS